MLFFEDTSACQLHKVDNLRNFLKHFPEQEIWRFFVERIQYNATPFIQKTFLYAITYPSYPILTTALEKQEIQKITATMATLNFNTITHSEVYAYAQNLLNCHSDTLLKTLQKYRIDNSERSKNLKLSQTLELYKAWVGFDLKEPGYFENIMQAWNLILSEALKNKPLTLAFIKRIHATCTNKVQGMLSKNVPGKLRSLCNACWEMSPYDSQQGWIENIRYLTAIEKQYKKPIFNIKIIHANNGEVENINSFRYYQEKDIKLLINKMWTAFKNHDAIYFATADNGNANFLNPISKALIRKLERGLKTAPTEVAKIRVIMTFLKCIVLHHIFPDGVGRTFSMLLSQYLFIREGLLPVILTNSNVIPAYSVDELVTEYIRSTAEMKTILSNPDYISSIEFAKPNIDTATLLLGCSNKEQDSFNASIASYHATKEQCLQTLVPQEITAPGPCALI